MAGNFNTIASRVASTLFVIALFALVVFFALEQIPDAQRPTLHDRPGTGVVSPSP